MTPGLHFMFAVISPLITAGLCGAAANSASPWIQDHGVYPPLAVLLATIAAWFSTRWAIRTWVPIRCSHCHAWACFEMQGHSNRFLCERCGRSS